MFCADLNVVPGCSLFPSPCLLVERCKSGATIPEWLVADRMNERVASGSADPRVVHPTSLTSCRPFALPLTHLRVPSFARSGSAAPPRLHTSLTAFPPLPTDWNRPSWYSQRHSGLSRRTSITKPRLPRNPKNYSKLKCTTEQAGQQSVPWGRAPKVLTCPSACTPPRWRPRSPYEAQSWLSPRRRCRPSRP